MTRDEAVAAAQAAGLLAPRIMPHKGKDGVVRWNLFHGPAGARSAFVVPANVGRAALDQAIAEAQVAPA